MEWYVPAGAIVNSALYVVLVFVAALLGHNTLAEYLAIGTAGVVYMSFAVEPWNNVAAIYMTILSIFLGAASGLALIV